MCIIELIGYTQQEDMEFNEEIERAKLALHAERYVDMAEAMNIVVRQRKSLSEEERNLFSIAYKNLIGAKRASWRILDTLEKKETSGPQKGNRVQPLEVLRQYRAKVGQEIGEMCEKVLSLLDDVLIPGVGDPDTFEVKGQREKLGQTKLFYQKLKGDIYRYMYEVEEDVCVASEMQSKSKEAYNSVSQITKEYLDPTSPIRLGLALSNAVFTYEILHDTEMACRLAKEAFDEAITSLDTLEDENYKDATLIMQLLRDNLTLWTKESTEGETGTPGS